MRAEDAQVGTCVVLTEEGRTYMADKMAEWSLDALPEAERYEPRAVRLRRLSTDAHLRDCARCDLPTEADVDAAEWLAKTADTRDPSRAADILVPIRDYRRLRKLGITDQASLDRAREALNRVGGAE